MVFQTLLVSSSALDKMLWLKMFASSGVSNDDGVGGMDGDAF
jgi:hypothetical protein